MTHGTAYGYNQGCRCDDCKGWKKAYSGGLRVVAKLRAIDLSLYNRVCQYADAHNLTLKRAAEELGSFQ